MPSDVTGEARRRRRTQQAVGCGALLLYVVPVPILLSLLGLTRYAARDPAFSGPPSWVLLAAVGLGAALVLTLVLTRRVWRWPARPTAG